jgi:predicted ATPase
VKKGYTEGDGEGYRGNWLYVYTGVTECNKQWIVETHSELMILRLQRRIREKVLRSCDVAVLYVQSDEDGATVTELRLDEGGEFIDEWPDGFFDDGYLERYPRSYD